MNLSMFCAMRSEAKRERSCKPWRCRDGRLSSVRGSVGAILNAQAKPRARRQGCDHGAKVGIHSGPCIAVTLNARLDYFGCTVNMARASKSLYGRDAVISKGA